MLGLQDVVGPWYPWKAMKILSIHKNNPLLPDEDPKHTWGPELFSYPATFPTRCVQWTSGLCCFPSLSPVPLLTLCPSSPGHAPVATSFVVNIVLDSLREARGRSSNMEIPWGFCALQKRLSSRILSGVIQLFIIYLLLVE